MSRILNFHQSIAWFFSKKSLYLDNEGPWAVEMMAKVIIDLYHSLPTANHDGTEIEINIQEINKEEYSITDKGYLQPLFDLENYTKKELNRYFVDFLVHGSFATRDYSRGWSDLDTYLILNDRVFQDPYEIISLRDKLLVASKYLYKIDPLQHHGFIFATEYDTKNYFSHCLPVDVLKKSKSLIGNSKLNVKELRSTKDTLNFLQNKNKFFKKCFEESAMIHHGRDNIYLLENFSEREAMYQMKYFLSVLMSMPAFFLDALGKPVYKACSFEEAKKFFGEEWEIIDVSSGIRNKWQHEELHPYQNNLIPDWLVDDLGGDYFKRAYKLTDKMTKYFE